MASEDFHLPELTQSSFAGQPYQLYRTQTDPPFYFPSYDAEYHPSQSASLASLRPVRVSAIERAGIKMTAQATITFSRPGVKPPVYVVSSLNVPPWAAVEMDVSPYKTDSGDLMFTRHFENVPEGEFQYKVRIGEAQWAIDHCVRTIIDESGISNNIGVAVCDPQPDPARVSPDATAKEKRYGTNPTPGQATVPPTFGQGAEEQQGREGRIDSSTDETQLPAAPQIVVQEEPHLEPGTEEERAAPLFPHESLSSGPGILTPSDDSDSGGRPTFHHQNAADQSILAPRLTPSNASLFSHDAGGLRASNASVFSSETGFFGPMDDVDELSHGPLLSHERGLNRNELDDGPLFPHETDMSRQYHSQQQWRARNLSEANIDLFTAPQDGGLDTRPSELDRPPSLSHEILRPDVYVPGAPVTRRQRTTIKDEAPLMAHERPPLSYMTEAPVTRHARTPTNNEAPLPNEQSASAPSERTSSIASFGTFLRRTTAAEPIFGQRGGFAWDRNSGRSSLPHSLPPSDEEDDNLRDPSLEVFPTSREQILHRVATISTHLPEDESSGSPYNAQSPDPSVLSQACSSVELAPISSHLSLRAIAEDTVLEDEEDGNDSNLPSPALMIPTKSATADQVEPREDETSGDELATPMPREEWLESASVGAEQEPTVHCAQSSDPERIRKRNGASDGTKRFGRVFNTVATPTTVLNPPTPPMAPERALVNPNGRRTYPRPLTRESMRISPAPPRFPVGGPSDSPPPNPDDFRTPTPTQLAEPENEGFFTQLLHAMFCCSGMRSTR
ncbi:hypothetical protein BU26DRAFT_338398 [Trematosphaeria pertusa]|uniref:AMP-activated protein kinase glycogen-binding domain-containing protein n=1 Tax=Trematosphaeria pertusa TaxID=390896 RepID=A0A6A6IGB1_9PLEO|nr:uncharacterized protein BU26DRAFT_338398 [Trematosphaeria pertusa]KAF2248580.1 hypothetical protein BU26DRAFT_338398 [Trematosphaeria pertusa]